MSKMGISTVASYTGAQIFEAIGLGRRGHRASTSPGRRRRLGGIGFDEIAAEAAARHAGAYPARAGRPGAPAAASRRRVPVAPRRRAAPVQPGDGVPAAARHPLAAGTTIFREYTRAGRRPVGPADDAARPVAIRGVDDRRGRPPVPARRGRAGRRDRQAVRHRRDVLRLDLGRGARDAGHRDEPARRPVQHRRGRRGRRAVLPRRQRRPAPVGGQAGGQRPVRGDQRVPGQRRRPADQDGAGRQAGRGRPAARPQGLPVDRQDPARHRRASA